MLFFLFALILSAPVVTDNDILMTKQTYGETKRDLSVDGNPLSISGITYTSGIGTHATSQIPITIPNNAKGLSGACGIDDEVGKSAASVIFRIFSGSEVLWESPIKHFGDAPSSFFIQIPLGSKKLYLIADEYDTNSNDHADWVNLKWEEYIRESVHPKQVTQLKANSRQDSGPLLRAMITQARSNPGSTILLEKGIYHFYLQGAMNFSFHISNHDQPTYQPVAIPLVDLENVTIDGSGSTFYFHNLLIPVLIMDSKNVKLINVHIDFQRPLFNEAEVVDAGFFTTEIRINKAQYPYRIENSKFVFENEGFEQGVNFMLLFDRETKRIINGTGDVFFSGIVTENKNGTVTFTQNLKKYGLKPGDFLCLRGFTKPYPGVTIYRAVNTVLDHVEIHSAEGMALLAQRSDNIDIINSGVTYAEGRYTTTGADSSHFSNVKGQIRVENCLYEGMMDDSINIHQTSLKITEIVNKSYIKLEYIHEQSVGFETILPGERIRFIHSKTLENDEFRNVTKVFKRSTCDIEVLIEGEVPSTITVGDSVENGVYYASVIYRNNTVRNNRARGCLFTTPMDVLVENNFFDYVSGSAILLAGDAANWYESGACQNVVIRNNRFLNALTVAGYQFTNAIFSFSPTIGDIKKQKTPYHRNIRIENNVVDTFDVPLLYSISCRDIVFRNNTINYNDDYPGWDEKAFQFNKVLNITIGENHVTPSKIFTIDDVKLENTEESEIHFI